MHGGRVSRGAACRIGPFAGRKHGDRFTAAAGREVGPRYKWIALSNTTMGVLIITINQSIVLIALPDIFRGIGVNPLAPGSASLLLWLLTGYSVVTAVLVVSFGRLGDMFGRVKMFNLGFAIFTVFSVLLSVTWLHGPAAAWFMIGIRLLQAVGGAMIMANSAAILTDAFPSDERGLALGLNLVAALAGVFIGLVLGGLLAPISWRLVFLVSVPFGVMGTIWSYLKLKELGIRKPARLDWWGNVTFAVGLVSVLVGITYGIQPYRGHALGWTNPMVLAAIFGGLAVLGLFCVIETRVDEPMFQLSLFKIRPFTAGNVASLLSGLGLGGMQFIVIIWLQGIYLPMHGYSFEKTPLWAGIAMLPLTIGFLIAGPLSGWLSDRYGARPFATGGMLVAALSFLLLELLPVNFQYWQFAGHPAPERPRQRLVRLAQPGRDHEQPAAGAPRRRRGHEHDVHQHGHGALPGHLLHADRQRPGFDAARRPPPRPGRAGRAAGRRGPAGRTAAGVDPVRRAARLQPDPAAARSRPGQAVGEPRRHPHRAHVPAVADLAAVPARPGHRV